jgi:hypothetical protein
MSRPEDAPPTLTNHTISSMWCGAFPDPIVDSVKSMHPSQIAASQAKGTQIDAEKATADVNVHSVTISHAALSSHAIGVHGTLGFRASSADENNDYSVSVFIHVQFPSRSPGSGYCLNSKHTLGRTRLAERIEELLRKDGDSLSSACLLAMGEIEFVVGGIWESRLSSKCSRNHSSAPVQNYYQDRSIVHGYTSAPCKQTQVRECPPCFTFTSQRLLCQWHCATNLLHTEGRLHTLLVSSSRSPPIAQTI